MDPLRQWLFEEGRVGKAFEALNTPKPPDPVEDPERALLLGHALSFYGDYPQAIKVFSLVPTDTPLEAERLWGLGHALLRFGEFRKATQLLEEALDRCPDHPQRDWLCARIANSQASLLIYQGQLDKALRVIEKAVENARRSSQLTEQTILDGSRGVVKMYQGAFEEAIFFFQKSARQAFVRGNLLAAANPLINLAGALDNLGDSPGAERCLSRAEELIRRSGSRGLLITLRQTQGELLRRAELLEKAKQIQEEALVLLRELPNPIHEAQLSTNLAYTLFQKGDLGGALDLIRKTLALVRERGLGSIEAVCLGCEGEMLLYGGAVEEGLSRLTRAQELASGLGLGSLDSSLHLLLAVGYEERKDQKRALECLQKCFQSTERCRTLSLLLRESKTLIPLLIKLIPDLPLMPFLSQLLIQFRHPALLGHLLRRSAEGKVLFLRSLKVYDARHFRPQLARLWSNPQKDVRRTARHLLHTWQEHASYRVSTLGPFRLFLEGALFLDRDWIRPGAKRLFLYLASYPGEWHPTEVLLEALWRRPHPQRTRRGLSILFTYLRRALEPWRLSGRMDYVFFQSRRGAYGFFPQDRFWMDYWEFEQGIKRAEQAQLKRSFKEARQSYREALDLYLGDYLEEFPYEDFLRPKRDYLRELYFRSALRYAKLEQDSGNPLEARRVLEEAIFKDLSRSGLVVPLIEVLSRMGLREEAKAWGERHVGYLKKELKEKPAPEVKEALAQLR